MCASCGPETIWHVEGERSVSREHCFCACHDRDTEEGHQESGVARDDLAAALTACARCQWAHVVAFSTADWRSDERYMRGPSPQR